VLGLGQYFGRVPHRWAADSIVLSPVIHDQRRVNVEHAHEAAFVTLMLAGEYTEKAALRSYRFERFTAIYHPPALEHQDFVGGPGVRLLMFEFRPELVDAIDIKRSDFRSLRDLSGSRIAWDLLALYHDALRGSDPLDFESRALQLIARLAPVTRTAALDTAPLQRAREYLHAHFQERLMMKDIARAAGIHPVYLGQSFQRRFGETVGSYATRLRIRAAAEVLSTSDIPLATLAFDYGFCDQSHFQRVFKRFAGVTPAAFRSRFDQA
jgi:AraC family transcriptional regulator